MKKTVKRFDKKSGKIIKEEIELSVILQQNFNALNKNDKYKEVSDEDTVLASEDEYIYTPTKKDIEYLNNMSKYIEKMFNKDKKFFEKYGLDPNVKLFKSKLEKLNEIIDYFYEARRNKDLKAKGKATIDFFEELKDYSKIKNNVNHLIESFRKKRREFNKNFAGSYQSKERSKKIRHSSYGSILSVHKGMKE